MNTSLTTLRPVHYDIIDAEPNLQPSTRNQYKRVIDLLIEARIDPRNIPALKAYVQGLSGSSRAFLKAALNVIYKARKLNLKTNATAENINYTHAQLLNLDAMTDLIHIQKQHGAKSPLWLTPAQVEDLTSKPDRTTISGRRDWIVLALALSGLRREEVATITFDRIQKRPMTNNQPRTVLEVTGKGAKDRTVPVKPLLEKYLKEWRAEAGDGLIARSVNKAGTINGSLSSKTVYAIVKRYGAIIGVPELEPHDLRRTYAMIGWNNTHDLILVMRQLGHESPATTKKYLNLEVSLDTAISDFIPLSE